MVEPKKKTMIIQITYGFYPITGGSVIDTIEILKIIREHALVYSLLVPNFANTEEFDTIFASNYNVNLIRLPENKLLKKLFNSSKVPSFIKSVIFTLNVLAELKKIILSHTKTQKVTIITHGITIGSLLTFLITPLRRILKERYSIEIVSAIFLHGSLEHRGKMGRYYENMISKIARPNWVFVVDDGSLAKRKFIKIFGEDKATAFYHPHLPRYKDSSISQINTNIIKYHEKLGRKFIIVSSHNFYPVKNIEDTIISFHKFIQKYRITNSYLILIGSGPLEQHLKKLANKLGIGDKIKFTGMLNNKEVTHYVKSGDCFVSTSKYSNLNNSTKEALLMGTPVLAFDSGGTSRIIINNKTGMLIPNGDTTALSNAMYTIYTNPKLKKKMSYMAYKVSTKRIKNEKSISKVRFIRRLVTS